MLCARIQPGLLQSQSVDQAAYRPGFSTEDHLLSVTLLLERCHEWNIEFWMCLVDLEKALDTVEHEPLWKFLMDLGVHPAYVDLLKVLYKDQSVTVIAGCRSREFSLQRGVKQGDPISVLLFIAVMEAIFGKLKSKWQSLNSKCKLQYYGFVIDDPSDPLTNLRFADDVLLFGNSRADIGKMITELSREAKKYGLKIHMGKTKIMTNAASRKPLCCDGNSVEVLDPAASERYLGRQLAIEDYHSTELTNRIRCVGKPFSNSRMPFATGICHLRAE